MVLFIHIWTCLSDGAPLLHTKYHFYVHLCIPYFCCSHRTYKVCMDFFFVLVDSFKHVCMCLSGHICICGSADSSFVWFLCVWTWDAFDLWYTNGIYRTKHSFFMNLYNQNYWRISVGKCNKKDKTTKIETGEMVSQPKRYRTEIIVWCYRTHRYQYSLYTTFYLKVIDDTTKNEINFSHSITNAS